MYENILMNRSFYDSLLAKKEAEVLAAEENNKRRDILETEKAKTERLLGELERYRERLSVLKAAVEHENDRFHTRRLEFLNDTITESVAKIFPQMGLTAKVYCDFNRRNKTRMSLFDKHGREHLPRVCQGKLMQYLISFAAVAGITKGLGMSSLYVDEAFGAGAEAILPEVGSVVQAQVDEGMQVVLVSQHSDLYSMLPRHVIKLQTDLDEDCVTVREEDV